MWALAVPLADSKDVTLLIYSSNHAGDSLERNEKQYVYCDGILICVMHVRHFRLVVYRCSLQYHDSLC